mmetsp:Transcript_12863/g.19466  ORF Transcript_12863/g.19466 Transcript_12863/m.19466 type:complete len:179 (+) Transcript_12863:83-619(+)
MLSDLLIILTTSLCNAFLTEGLTWMFIYRTESYQTLKQQIDRMQRKVDKDKEAKETNALLSSKALKKAEKNEEQLKALNSQLAFTKLKSFGAVAMTMVVLYGLLGSIFEGVVVAHLPFEPFSLIRGLTHRNLSGSVYTHCSFAFFYVLCSMCIKGNVQKYYGHVPRTASVFQPPPEEK